MQCSCSVAVKYQIKFRPVWLCSNVPQQVWRPIYYSAWLSLTPLLPVSLSSNYSCTNNHCHITDQTRASFRNCYNLNMWTISCWSTCQLWFSQICFLKSLVGFAAHILIHYKFLFFCTFFYRPQRKPHNSRGLISSQTSLVFVSHNTSEQLCQVVNDRVRLTE